MGPGATDEDLLAGVVREGQRVHRGESLDRIRSRVRAGLMTLLAQIRRIDHPQEYPVRLEPRLAELKVALIAAVDNGD